MVKEIDLSTLFFNKKEVQDMHHKRVPKLMNHNLERRECGIVENFQNFKCLILHRTPIVLESVLG